MNEGFGTTTADIAGDYDAALGGDASWVVADSDDNDFLDICQVVVPDCNLNDVADAADVSGGTSADCNTNGAPDECDTGMLADYDVDGDVDDDDYAGFEACLFGPAMDMQSMSPCGASCLQWFDTNGDHRIDLFDFGYLQEHMSSP